MSIRRTVIWGLLAMILCLAVGLITGHTISVKKPIGAVSDRNLASVDNPVVKSFIAAKSVVPGWDTAYSSNVKAWDCMVKLGNDVSLDIKAVGWIGGKFVGKYSDASLPVVMGDPGDYVYPCDLRIDTSRMRAYCKASGLAGGLWHQTVIFEFDMVTRKLLATVYVDPRILPVDPEPKDRAPAKR